MSFSWHEVEQDETFVQEADPEIRKAMKREAGASVLQDIALNTYYANTGGKTYYPGTYHLYLKELCDNLCKLMCTKMTYKQMEEFLVVLGYEASDIRKAFEDQTGFDPAKLEFQRLEDVKNTPANIPWYNLGWGWAKKKSDKSSYFIMPYRGGVATLFRQVDDMTREEVGNFATLDEAREYAKNLVQRLHVYDIPACDQVKEAVEPMKAEPEKKEYMVMANYLYDLGKKGQLDKEAALEMIERSITSGILTQDEGQSLVDLYVEAAPPGVDDSTPQTERRMDRPTEIADPDYQQETSDVTEEVENTTPQDFFQSALPDRLDQITSQHVKDVMSYIARRQKDIEEFEIGLHSLRYIKHETPRALVDLNPDHGRPSGPPRATVSVVLEVMDRTLPKDSNLKYALAVFFVAPDGDVGTSDSLKGEDDVIYGFSEEGLQQYFLKDRAGRMPGA